MRARPVTVAVFFFAFGELQNAPSAQLEGGAFYPKTETDASNVRTVSQIIRESGRYQRAQIMSIVGVEPHPGQAKSARTPATEFQRSL